MSADSGLTIAQLTRRGFHFDWSQRNWRAGWHILPVPALAIVVGLAVHQPLATLAIVGAAVTAGFGAVHQLTRYRLVPMVVAALGFAVSAFAGAVLGRHDFWAGLLVTLIWGAVFGAATSLGQGAWWVGLQCVIALLVSAAYPTGLWPATQRVLLVLLGAGLQILSTSVIWWIGREPFTWTTVFEPFAWNLQPTRWGFRFPLGDAGLRYTARVAAVLTVATLITRHLWPWPNGYWIPMTAAIVLKTDFQTTYTRGITRLAGTLLGVALVTLLMALLRPSAPLLGVLILACLWACFTHQRVNYGLFATFITAYVVLLLALGGLPEPAVALRRTAATILGGGLALGSFVIVRPGKSKTKTPSIW